MFIGHFAVGFASKRFAPRTNLALLMAAPLFLDILWPVFVLMGWERVRIDPGNTRFTPLDFIDYPWSHSLLMSIGWATVFAISYQLAVRYWPGTVLIWIGFRTGRTCPCIPAARVSVSDYGIPSPGRWPWNWPCFPSDWRDPHTLGGWFDSHRRPVLPGGPVDAKD
jgi:hypothetical protein